MKYFLISMILASSYMILVFGVKGKLREDIENSVKACQADPKTHINGTIDKKIEDGKIVDLTTMGPHLACLMKRLGILDQNGKIVDKKLKEYIGLMTTDKEVKKTLLNCVEQKDNIEETSINIMNCLLSNVDFSKI